MNLLTVPEEEEEGEEEKKEKNPNNANARDDDDGSRLLLFLLEEEDLVFVVVNETSIEKTLIVRMKWNGILVGAGAFKMMFAAASVNWLCSSSM